MTDIYDPSDRADPGIANAFSQHPVDEPPPAGLEEQTVAGLRQRDLLAPQPKTTQQLVARPLVAAALAVAVFSAGLVVGRIVPSTSPASEPRFALLLYGASTSDDPALHTARAAEYSEWARKTHATGSVEGGEALASDGVTLRLATTDEAAESNAAADMQPGTGELAGYFLVTAPTIEDAVRLARDCPHLKYGGTTIVRRILPT